MAIFNSNRSILTLVSLVLGAIAILFLMNRINYLRNIGRAKCFVYLECESESTEERNSHGPGPDPDQTQFQKNSSSSNETDFRIRFPYQIDAVDKGGCPGKAYCSRPFLVLVPSHGIYISQQLFEYISGNSSVWCLESSGSRRGGTWGETPGVLL